MKNLGSCLLFLCIITLSGAQTGDDAIELHAFLFNRSTYNKGVRPIKNQSLPIQVGLAFTLTSVQDLDSVVQKISTVGILAVTWKDEFLTWDRIRFGDITSITVFQNEIWHPNLFLGTAVEDINYVGSSVASVRITDAGIVAWLPPGVFKFTCTFDVRFYPFDTQTCDLDFAISGYSVNEITLTAPLKDVNLDRYTENAEWELLSAKSKIYMFDLNGMQPQVFRNTLVLKRRSNFIVMHSVVPLILLSILNILVFALPAESGEKVSLSITLFLAFAIFLTMLSESLPKSSLTLPVLSMYLISINTLSTIYVISTVVVLKIYHLPSETPVPTILQSILARHLLCRRRTCHSKVNHQDDRIATKSLSELEGSKLQNEKQNGTKTPCLCLDITWMDISRALDTVFLWLFSILFVISTVVFGSILLQRS